MGEQAGRQADISVPFFRRSLLLRETSLPLNKNRTTVKPRENRRVRVELFGRIRLNNERVFQFSLPTGHKQPRNRFQIRERAAMFRFSPRIASLELEHFG